MESKNILTKTVSVIFMKISILLLISTALSVPKIKAQVPYTPFPKGDIAWTSLFSYGGPNYRLSIDTVSVAIENKIYNKVYFGKCNDEQYIAGVREEDKKIYLYVPELGEHIIYDFGLEIGDRLYCTIQANMVPNASWDNYTLTFSKFKEDDFVFYYIAANRKTVTLINGDVRNVLTVSGVYGTNPYWSYNVDWVEGLGDVNIITHFGLPGFISSIFHRPFALQDWDKLLCICQNNTKLMECNELSMPDCQMCKTNQINEIFRQSVSIYPNPTSGELTIENGQLKIRNIEIFDAFGKNVEVETFLLDENKIDISHLSSGIYIIKITTENGIAIKKFVKK